MNKAAVHALQRILQRHAIASAIVEEADAGFDGGEWSRGWHSKKQEEREEQILADVAARFGLEPAELERQHRQWSEESAQAWGPDPLGAWHGRNL